MVWDHSCRLVEFSELDPGKLGFLGLVCNSEDDGHSKQGNGTASEYRFSMVFHLLILISLGTVVYSIQYTDCMLNLNATKTNSWSVDHLFRPLTPTAPVLAIHRTWRRHLSNAKACEAGSFDWSDPRWSWLILASASYASTRWTWCAVITSCN